MVRFWHLILIALIVALAGCGVAYDTDQYATVPAAQQASTPSVQPSSSATPETGTTPSTGVPNTPRSTTIGVPASDTAEAQMSSTPEGSDAGEAIEGMTQAEIEALVKADLATTLGVTEEHVHIRETSNRTWPDKNLGCAARKGLVEPGPVAGYEIILAYGDQTFRYHTDQRGHFVRCPEPSKPIDPIR